MEKKGLIYRLPGAIIFSCLLVMLMSVSAMAADWPANVTSTMYSNAYLGSSNTSPEDESPYEEVARYGTDERCVKIRNLEKRSADYVLEGIWFEDSNPVKELCSIDTKPKNVKPGGVIELCAPVCQEALKTRNPVYFSGLIIKAEDR